VQQRLDSASKTTSIISFLTDKNAVILGTKLKIPELPISSWQQPYLSFASIHNLHRQLAFK
jgi:hypothetical protein